MSWFYQNCHDFWTNGGALGVDYTALYEIPDNGKHSRASKRLHS